MKKREMSLERRRKELWSKRRKELEEKEEGEKVVVDFITQPLL